MNGQLVVAKAFAPARAVEHDQDAHRVRIAFGVIAQVKQQLLGLRRQPISVASDQHDDGQRRGVAHALLTFTRC